VGVILAIAGRREETAGLLVTGALGAAASAHLITTIAAAPAVPDILVLLDASEGSARTLASLSDSALVIAYTDDAAVANQVAGTAARVVGVGLSPAADVRASDIDTTLDGTSFTAHAAGGARVPVSTPVVGESVAPLVLAAIAVALETGADAATAAAALRTTAAAPSDMTVSRLADGLVVIDDTLDGTPDSVSAALKALAQVTIDGTRSVAVLGELDLDGELDATEVREAHDRIGRLVVRLNVSLLIVVGASARHIHNAAGLEGSWDGESLLVDTPEEAYAALGDSLRPRGDTPDGVVILVKPSATADLRSLGNRIGTVNACSR
jgi:UDP-N-acetylmuramoyl-tripeptide--D-alanyl-D-alanine ligase